MKKCKNCGVKFEPNRPWQKFHSPACSKEYWSNLNNNRARITESELRNCDKCNRAFESLNVVKFRWQSRVVIGIIACEGHLSDIRYALGESLELLEEKVESDILE